LNPYTSEIVAIGLIDEDGNEEHLLSQVNLGGPYDEVALLGYFWSLFRKLSGGPIYTKFLHWSGSGHSGSFDLTQLITRSRIRRVPVPATARKGRYWGDAWVDVAAEWLLNDSSKFCSLTRACEILGLYEDAELKLTRKKPDDPVTGANCWQWMGGTAQSSVTFAPTPGAQRELALSYLSNDTRSLLALANVIL
jgi:hypothetical protein